jgi:hypothetical protein
MSLERTIDKMNRDSSIIESISAQQVTVPKIGIPISSDQDPSRSLKIDMNPACKHLLSNIRQPIPAIPLSREDSPDPKDPMKLSSGSPDRSMPPPPPRMPPGVSNADALGGWTTDRGFGHQLMAMPFGPGGSSLIQSGTNRSPNTAKSDSALAGYSSGVGASSNSNPYHHTAPQRPPNMGGDSTSPDPQADGSEGRGFGSATAAQAGSSGAARAAIEFAADAVPTCNICPHRMQDVLIYNWSNVWSLYNLR